MTLGTNVQIGYLLAENWLDGCLLPEVTTKAINALGPEVDRARVVEELRRIRWATVDFAVQAVVTDETQRLEIRQARDRYFELTSEDDKDDKEREVLARMLVELREAVSRYAPLIAQMDVATTPGGTGSKVPWAIGKEFAAASLAPQDFFVANIGIAKFFGCWIATRNFLNDAISENGTVGAIAGETTEPE